MKMCRALGVARPHVAMSLTYADFIAALPVQSSARLTYRNLMPHDAPALHKIVSQWEVVRQLGSWPWPADYDRTLARAAPFAGEGLVWGIFLHSALIGMLGITKGGLGYFIDPAHQRRGYGREAVRFALEHAAQPYVEAEVWQDNPASLGLLYSLGFSILHPMQQMSKARGVMTDGFKLSWQAPLP
jgi:RimJ/RimL family protein N-acetyltransferase